MLPESAFGLFRVFLEHAGPKSYGELRNKGWNLVARNIGRDEPERWLIVYSPCLEVGIVLE